jgi:hypothetical protein
MTILTESSCGVIDILSANSVSFGKGQKVIIVLVIRLIKSINRSGVTFAD